MTESNSWQTADGSLALGFAAHGESMRGQIRHALIHRGITEHLTAPGRVLDVGGGQATQALMLAQLGHQVTVVDKDPEMIRHAEQAVARHDTAVQARVRIVLGDGEDAVNLAGDGFDLVSCHVVLTYLHDPLPVIRELVRAARPGGLISVAVKNAAALALRPALEQRWADALAALDTEEEVGNLQVPTQAHHLKDLADQFGDLGARLEQWYGIRCVTDHLKDTPPGPDRDLIIRAEWELGRRTPYRAIARLVHLILRREAQS